MLARFRVGARQSLQRRIVASVMLGLGIVLVGIGYVVVLTVAQTTESTLRERLALARAKQHELDQEIQDTLDFLTRMASERPIRPLTGDPAAARLWLQRMDTAGLISAAVLIDLQRGAVVASGGATPRWLPSFKRLASLVTRRTPSVFEIQAIPPTVGLATPVLGEPGEAVWLVAELALSRLRRHLLPEHLGSGIYEAEVLNGRGHVAVASFDHGQVSSGHAALIADFASRGKAGMVLHKVPEKGRDHYVAYVPLTTVPGWGVITEQPVDVVAALPLRLRRWMVGIGAAVLAAGALAAWLDVQRVVAPLRVLTGAAQRIGRGDLTTPVAVESDDEVGILARTLEEMRSRLERSLEEIRHRETRAQALYATSTQILTAGDRDQMLKSIVDQARTLLGREAAVLCLPESGTQRPVIVATGGPGEAFVRGHLGPQPVGGTAMCDPVRCGLLAPEYRAGHLFAPLTVGGQTLGHLCVGDRVSHETSDADRALLAGLANLAALAVENARLQAEVASVATVRERERIAREFHDGLAQAFSSLHAMAALARLRAERVGAEEVTRVLHEMEEVSGSAYEEIRQSIFGLRTVVADGPGLVPTIAEYLREFEARSGLHATVVVEDGAIPRLPAEVETQLVRIVGEALHNVWRHARARRAEVRIGIDGTMVQVTVEDDGVGFDPKANPPSDRRHYGLQTMRERAESVGGTLQIISAPGQGTRVVVWLPPVR